MLTKLIIICRLLFALIKHKGKLIIYINYLYMESAPSSIIFFCPKCKQKFPLSSKELHSFVCGGEQNNQNNNNNIIKNDIDLLSEVFGNSNNNEVIDINAAPYYPQEDNQKENSISQPKYPVWKEEYEEKIDASKKQNVIEHSKKEEEKKEEPEKKEEEGILSKIKEYGTSIKDYGTMVGKVGTGLGLCAFGTYIGSPAMVNFGLNVIANNIGENNSIQNPPPPSNTQNSNENVNNSNENVNDEIVEQYRLERLRLEREAQERERKEKEERERRQREAQERRQKEERERRQKEERERRQNNNNNSHNEPPLDSESIRLARLRNIERYDQYLRNVNENNDNELSNLQNCLQILDIINHINNQRDINDNILQSQQRNRKDIINLLPVTQIKDNDHKPKGNCIICLGDFLVKEEVTSLPCLHIFHNQCIKVWLRDHNVCPVCKLKLNNDNLGLE